MFIYIFSITYIIELDDGKILTGKPHQFDGKNPWVSCKLSLKPIQWYMILIRYIRYYMSVLNYQKTLL